MSPEKKLALKPIVLLPQRENPNFAWGEAISSLKLFPLSITVLRANKEWQLSVNGIADEVISIALINLLLYRKESGIVSELNCRFVASTLQSIVVALLIERVKQGRVLYMSEDGHFLLIERAVIENTTRSIIANNLSLSRSLEAQSIYYGNALPQDQSPTKIVCLVRHNGLILPGSAVQTGSVCCQGFLATKQNLASASKIADAVSAHMRQDNKTLIHIENIQDLVQEELKYRGRYRVVPRCTLYHHTRQSKQIRQRFLRLSGQPDSPIVVRTTTGQSVLWDGNDLKRRIQFASIGLDLCLNSTQIESELRRSIGIEIAEDILRKTIILNAKTLIERDADFARFAGRILLSYIYEEALDWHIMRDGIEGLKRAHYKAFSKYLERAISIERLTPKLLSYDLGRLADSLDPSADLDFEYLGIQTLYDRYLVVDKTTKPVRRLETPQFFWMRVAMGIFLEDFGDRTALAIQLYYLYKNRRFCSSTPTLFNSGTLHSQLSSCYLYKVDDSIESIMQRGIADNAYLAKWAGGLGGSWTAVRGTGSHIKGTNGESQGVIPFLKLHNDQLVAVNQGGKRRGSGCAYLEIWHNDIFDFLKLRVNTGDERRRTHDMNTANWIPDLFMKRVEARKSWTLFRSNEVQDLHGLYGRLFEERYQYYELLAHQGQIFGQEVPAIDLWKEMLKMLFETGHPWLTFKDPCNIRSPQDHVGVVYSSNLCTEITLNANEEETAVCNLGSIVLDSHLLQDGSINHVMLRETIQLAVRALDNVIDINFYPIESSRRSNLRHRPIGLGVMGLQNALYKRGIGFASQAAVEFNDEFMEVIAFYAYSASSDLAAERGTYKSYAGSKWDRGLLPQDTIAFLEQERGRSIEVPQHCCKMDWEIVREKIRKQGMRNSNVLAIAPTATISNIMGTTPCIEPNFRNLYVKSNLGGDFVVLNRELVLDLKKEGLWNAEMLDQLKYFNGELKDIPNIPEILKEKHLTVFSINSNYIIDAAARRQKWIDQSQSVTLFLSNPDMKTLSHMYRAAWRKGLKTTYYLRILSASDVEKITLTKSKKQVRGIVAKTATSMTATAMCSLVTRQPLSHGPEECEACQ